MTRKTIAVLALIGIICGAWAGGPPPVDHTNQDATVMHLPGADLAAGNVRILDVWMNYVRLEEAWAMQGQGDNCFVALQTVGCETTWMRVQDALDHYAWWLVVLNYCPSLCNPYESCYSLVEVPSPCQEQYRWVDLTPVETPWTPDYVPDLDCPPDGWGPMGCSLVTPIVNRLDPCLDDCWCSQTCPEGGG